MTADAVTAELEVSPLGALAVVTATVVMYLLFLALVRIVGQRSLSVISTNDIACFVALGAVVGRTALLSVPTLGKGVVALVTLFAMHRLLAATHRRGWFGFLVRRPQLLMMNGQICQAQLRRARVDEGELRQRLRLAGIARPEEVAAAVLEPNGQISVVRGSCALDPYLFEDVPGAAAWQRGAD